jgi:putative ABC transport system permease protein
MHNLEVCMHDLRHALRLVTKAPLFSVIVVLTLALGIGANTAIFTVVDQVLLRPLPLSDPESLVRIQEQHRRPQNVTGATFHDLHQRSRTLEALFAYRIFTRNVTDAGQQAFPEQVDAAFVSHDFFKVAGIAPTVGRMFSSNEFRKDGPSAVILSDRLWRHMFAADRNIVGQTILFHGEPAQVVGVMPPGLSFPEDVQAWSPLTEDNAFQQNRRAHLFTTIGRLKPGVTLEQGRAELAAIGKTIEADNHAADPGLMFLGEDLQTSIVGDVRPALLILLGAVGFVLLIACGNVANLLLARAVGRQKDLAIRTALGASRWQLIRLLLSESLMLATGGGMLGVLFGLLAVRWIATSFPGSIPRLNSAALDWRVMLFAIAVSLTSALIAGLAPAWQFSHVDPLTALNSSARGTESPARRRIRSALLVAEVALAVVLLAGAGLLIRSFVRVQQINPGYEASNLAVIPISLPGAKYDSFEKRLQFTNAAVESIRSIPGVRSVAASGVLPLRPAPATDFELVGKPLDPANEPSADVFTATPEYFSTMSIPLLAGRTFTEADTQHAPTVVLISQTMASAYYAGENPIGRTIIMKDWGDPLPAQIVGIVGDIRQQSVESAPKPAVYFTYAQFTQGTLVTYLVAKTNSNPRRLMSAIRERIWSVDRQQPVEVTTMEDVLADSLARRRFTLTLLGSFAGLALLLATVGVYGVISYSVSQRTQEFGIRMAIGAQRHHVLSMVMQQGMKIATIGLSIGLACALALTRTIRSLLFDVSAADPLTFAGICTVLMGLALVACLAPAYRATKVDPMEALRYE